MMYEYTVYWIRDEIANHYFHKSDILYRFLKDYQLNSHRLDLQKQFIYITNKFVKDIMISHIEKQIERKESTEINVNGTYMEIKSKRHFIMLRISDRQLIFHSHSLQDAEELLFPLLRQIQPFLFVVGNTINNYGWISPMKLPRNTIENQVLYSWQ